MIVLLLTSAPGPTWPPMVSAIAASLALLVSLINFIVTFRNGKRIKKLDFKAAIIKYRQDIYKEIRSWAEAVTKAMTEGSTLCEFNPTKMKEGELFNKHRQLVNDLSYLMDRGRLYLPNEHPDKHGTHKQGAYQGFRPEALNIINEYLQLALQFNYEDKAFNKSNLQKPFNDIKRRFVSEIQSVIEVRRINAEVEELVDYLNKMV